MAFMSMKENLVRRESIPSRLENLTKQNIRLFMKRQHLREKRELLL